VSLSNQATYIFFGIRDGNTNAFKYGGTCARSGQVNRIANKFRETKVAVKCDDLDDLQVLFHLRSSTMVSSAFNEGKSELGK